jgi:hypothetical protein
MVPAMNTHDQELLDKQLRAVSPPARHDGVVMIAIVGMFLVGMTFGSLLSAPAEKPMQLAANAPAAFAPNGVSQTAR